MRRALLLALALALAPAALGGETPPAGAAPPTPFLLEAPEARPISAEALAADPPRFPFPIGESLVYAVRYFGVPVGHVRFEVARALRVDGRRVVHVVGTARTNAFFSLFYAIDDRSEAWIDADTMRTLQTATWVRHGGRKETYEEVAFDREARLVHVLEYKRHADRLREATLDTGPDVYDTFEAFYAVRALPLAPGTRTALPVYAHFEVRAVEIAVDRRTRRRSEALGETQALALRPRQHDEELPDGDGAGEVFVSDDARRVPLAVDGWFRSNEGFLVGGVSAELVAYEPGDGTDARPAPRAVPTLPARAAPTDLDDGRPVWEPPAAVERARARLGLALLDRKHPGASPRALLACGRLQAAERFPAPPFEGAGPDAGPAPPPGCALPDPRPARRDAPRPARHARAAR